MSNNFFKVSVSVIIGLIVGIAAYYLWKIFTWLIWVFIAVVAAYIAYSTLFNNKKSS